MSKKPQAPAFELPMGKRTPLYRFFEILPGVLSYGVVTLLVVLSLINPMWASIYLLIFVLTVFMRLISVAWHTVKSSRILKRSLRIDWAQRLEDLEDPKGRAQVLQSSYSTGMEFAQHASLVAQIAEEDTAYPKPSEITNVAVIAVYNESYDVIQPTVQSLVDANYSGDQLVVCIAYEERGGKEVERTVKQIVKEYKGKFRDITAVKHPDGLPNEVTGKGGNITYAGKYLQRRLKKLAIDERKVILTTLDSDNRPHAEYFSYLTYMYIIHPDRDDLSFQPMALFFNNIWDVPAPMRVAALGNTFWSMIVSMRPYMLRNFAAHGQAFAGLIKSDFWTTRSIVEDGHHYWRSYVASSGKARVVPMYIPIYQDAVLSTTFWQTVKAQFKQLRRWAYGASDVAYVASQVFSRHRRIPFWGGFARLTRAIDSYVTWATLPLMVFIGAWLPLILNPNAHQNIVAHQLPEIVSSIQQVALIGIFVSIYISLVMLPPRPKRYKFRRSVYMVLQWALVPVVAIVFHSMAAYTAQTHLMLGRYLNTFDVTDKATYGDVAKARQRKERSKASSKTS